LEPMKDTEFISQMANIASLEPMAKFSKGFTKFADSQNGLLAQSYLGNTVEISDQGETIVGVVEAVDRNDDGTISVVVDGNSFDPSHIKRVELTSTN